MLEQVFYDASRVPPADIGRLVAALGTLVSGADTDASELVDQIRGLEELKSAAAAAQARVTARFAAVQRSAQRAAGVPGSQLDAGIAAQVWLARRDSPRRGGRHLGLAVALTRELPHTLAALEAGQISEWRATLIARETACLSVEHRRQVDAELAACPGGWGAMGYRATAAEARRVGYRLDPYAVTMPVAHGGKTTAKRATTPWSHTAGAANPDRTRSSRPSHPPATPTPADHQHPSGNR